MKFNRFIALYRNLVENKKLSPPDELWDNVSEQLSKENPSVKLNDNDALFDDIQNHLDLEDSWQEISFNLDIDEVWDSIDAELSKKDKKRRLIWPVSISAAAGVLLLLSLWLSHHLIQPEFNPETFSENREEQKQEQQKPDKVNENNSRTLKGIEKQNSIPKSESTKTLVSTILFAKEEGKSRIFTSQQILKFQNETIGLPVSLDTSKNNMPIILPNKRIKVENPLLAAYELEVPKSDSKQPIPETRKINLKNWSIGLNGAVKNTWMLNQKTLAGFQATDMSSTKTKVVPDIGVFVGYNPYGKLSYAASFYHRSQVDQSWDEYVYGNYSNHQVQLSYTVFELMGKYEHKNSFLFEDKLTRRSIAGFYYSRLSSAKELLLSQTNALTTAFQQNDYGVILGQDWKMAYNRWNLNMGAYLKYGIPDIHKHGSSELSGFKNTHNASVEIRMGIEFML